MSELREWLSDYINDQRKTLRLYALGALLFFIGLGIIQGADKIMPPSIEQESYALLGILIGGTGFFIAMCAQVFLILFRFKRLGLRGKDSIGKNKGES